jgi:hypothetical protein
MEHNLITRYRDYLERRDKLLKLQADLERKPTEARIMRHVVLSEAFTKVHQSVMAALYDRTRLHAQRYKLDSLVTRFREAKRMSRELDLLKERVNKNPTSERIKKKMERLAKELYPVEQELMADAAKALDQIIDLESRDE